MSERSGVSGRTVGLLAEFERTMAGIELVREGGALGSPEFVRAAKTRLASPSSALAQRPVKSKRGLESANSSAAI